MQHRCKPDVKNTMQLHSQAKVKFYEEYLTRYLRILYKSPYIKNINIYDIFCGAGIYDDGKEGSPIVAYKAIKEVFYENKGIKKVNLYLNDGDKSRINNVQRILDEENEKNQCCDITYHNLQAVDFLSQIKTLVGQSKNDERNLIFIDPYGYKDINKEIIDALMSNKHTEIILFLPISQMYRFTSYALDNSSQTPYKPLNDFICSFFSPGHPIIKQEALTILQYISYLRDAFTYNGKYYSTSYHIERNKNHYFSLFFLTSHLYGLEKILEVKWDLNEVNGAGFNLPTQQLNLFAEFETEAEQRKIITAFENELKEYLKQQHTNNEVYRFALTHEFLPKHINQILTQWQDANKICVTDIRTKNPARRKSFYISYDNCKDAVYPKVYIQLV